jgi:cell division inhibitor SepF
MMGVMNRFMHFLGLQEEEEVVTRERVVEEEVEEVRPYDVRKAKGNVVSIHAQKNMKIVLTEPRAFEDTQEIADYLRSRRTVVVNLQRVRKDQAVKIVDFLSGTVYALNGSIAKVGPDIFLCAPDNVELQGTITEMLVDESDYIPKR